MSEFTHLQYDPRIGEPRWMCQNRLQERVIELERDGYHPAPPGWKRAFLRGVPREYRVRGPHLNQYRYVQCEYPAPFYYRFPIPYDWEEVCRFLQRLRRSSWRPGSRAEELKLECVQYLWGRPAVLAGLAVMRSLK